MLSFLNPLRDINFANVLFRMILIVILSGAVGIERSVKNRPAGFRTHILVGIGAATASMTGHYLYLNMQLPSDPMRIGAQIITGLSFLGAGTIIVTKKKTITGLTTAAGLWTTGIIGIATGAGFYEGAVIGTILILFTEIVLARIGNRITTAPEFRLKLTYSRKNALDDVMRACKNHSISISGLQISTEEEEERNIYFAILHLRSLYAVTADALLGLLRKIDGVEEVEIFWSDRGDHAGDQGYALDSFLQK